MAEGLEGAVPGTHAHNRVAESRGRECIHSSMEPWEGVVTAEEKNEAGPVSHRRKPRC